MRIGVGLSIPELATRGGRFSPASLFTSGVTGAWYDPSDINNYMAGLGPELVTNGSFSSSSNWLTTGNSSVSGGTGNLDGTAVAGLLYQAGIFSNGKCYQVEFDVVSVTGTLKCWNNDGTTIYSTTTSGRKSFTYIHAIASSNFLFRADLGSNIASVDNVSVREVTTIANATLFQDSAGTTPVTAVEQPVGLMLDKSQGATPGPELAINGNFDTDTTWLKGAGVTISGGAANFSAVAVGANRLYEQNVLGGSPAGKTYLISYVVSNYSAGSVRFVIGGGAGTYGTIRSANGTYSEIMTVAAGVTTNQIEIYVQSIFTGSIDNVSVKEIPGNHASQATAASRPVLRARYNLLTYSEQFDNAAWTKNRGSVTSNADTAPDGTTTADRFTGDGTSGSKYVLSSAITASVYTGSVYLKAGTNNFAQLFFIGDTTSFVNFDLSSGTVGTSGGTAIGAIVFVGNGWYRCVAVNSSSATTGFGVGVVGSASDSRILANTLATSILIWGADLRTGSSAGTYQRIAAATDYATAGFLPYLYFVTDDSFGTNSIDFTATDEMSVCAGVTKSSDAAAAILVELSATAASNAGTFYIAAPEGTGANYFSSKMRGSINPTPAIATSASFAAPITVVVSALGDVSTDTNLLRLNGTQVASNTGDQGTGNFGNYPLFIGRRNNATLPFEGRIYQLIVCGKTLSASELSATEAYVATKTGVVI